MMKPFEFTSICREIKAEEFDLIAKKIEGKTPRYRIATRKFSAPFNHYGFAEGYRFGIVHFSVYRDLDEKITKIEMRIWNH